MTIWGEKKNPVGLHGVKSYCCFLLAMHVKKNGFLFFVKKKYITKQNKVICKLEMNLHTSLGFGSPFAPFIPGARQP